MTSSSSNFGKKSYVTHSQAFLRKVFAGRRKVATAAAAMLAIGVAYHVMFGANGLTVYQQKRHQTIALRQQMQQMQQENEALKSHVERLQNDPEAIEHQAREELRLARPGEIIYTLPVK